MQLEDFVAWRSKEEIQARRQLLATEGVEAVQLPAKSPNCNAHIERFFRSLREKCLDRMIFSGEQSLLSAVKCYRDHYHAERNHLALANNFG